MSGQAGAGLANSASADARGAAPCHCDHASLPGRTAPLAVPGATASWDHEPCRPPLYDPGSG
jgi:hypothetical protein